MRREGLVAARAPTTGPRAGLPAAACARVVARLPPGLPSVDGGADPGARGRRSRGRPTRSARVGGSRRVSRGGDGVRRAASAGVPAAPRSRAVGRTGRIRSIGLAPCARRSASCRRGPGPRAARPRGLVARPASRVAAATGPAAGPGSSARRRRRPVARRVASRSLLDRSSPSSSATAPDHSSHPAQRRRRPFRRRVRCTTAAARPSAGRGRRPTARLGRLAARPVLERRADRERAREAVRLLVGERARGRVGLGEAAMAVVRAVRPFVAVVLERDERAGRDRPRWAALDRSSRG